MQTFTRLPFELLATPLASIFGSGFLVIVPVLAQSAGPYMTVAMAVVCLLAYLVGSIIRHNIRVAEPLLADGQDSTLNFLERSADISIVIAYVISITLYLHILASFVLSGIGQDTPLYNNLLTSAVIIIIAGVGIWRGLGVLGFMEKMGAVRYLRTDRPGTGRLWPVRFSGLATGRPADACCTV